MPTYEYRCPDGHKFDRLAKMSESAAELPCPECGKIAARQLSGGAGLVFKGSGFYLTDYGKNAHRKEGGETVAAGEKKSAESSGGDKGGGDKGGGDSKGSDAKPSESKSSESKSSESSKPTESKSSASKSTDAKAAPSSGSSSASGSKPEK